MINQVASLETLCVDSMRINDLQAIQFDVCKIKILNVLKKIIPSIHTDIREDLARWTFASLNEEFRYIQIAYTRLQDSLPVNERKAINFNSILDYRNAQIALEYNNYAQIAQAVLREVQLNLRGILYDLEGILNDGNLTKKEKIESIKAWFINEENRPLIHVIRNLGTTHIRGTNLTRIPEEIQRFIGLRKLHLFQNQISKIENLPAGLRDLNLSQNQIRKIENLNDGLNWLFLDQNQIRERPHNLPANLALSMENQNDPLKNRLRIIIVLSVFVVLLSYLIERRLNYFRRD